MKTANYISPQIKALAIESDTAQKAAYVELAKWQFEQQRAESAIYSAAGAQRSRIKKAGRYEWSEYPISFTEAWDIAATKSYAKQALDQWTSAWVKVTELKARIAELEAIWKKYRWERAYLVRNANGHVHSSTACSTCYPTTVFDWRTEYSGSSEREIVAAAGELACTVCYPTAPVDVLSRPSAFTAEERAAAEAAKAERAAAKAAREAEAKAKAPTASGEPLVITWQEYEEPRFGSGWTKETFKTERSAISWAVDALYWDILSTYKQPKKIAQVAVVAESIAEKRGVEAAALVAEWTAKAQKKARQG
jgi:hypothetical protein